MYERIPYSWTLSFRGFNVHAGEPVPPEAKADLEVLARYILRHLGAWHDPPARLSPPGTAGPYTYEPCTDGDPMPDYENVITD